MTSNHHNKQVECMLLTPLTPGGSVDTGGKVWTGAADGTVYFWSDEDGTGTIEAGKGKSVAVPGNRRKEWVGGGEGGHEEGGDEGAGGGATARRAEEGRGAQLKPARGT